MPKNLFSKILIASICACGIFISFPVFFSSERDFHAIAQKTQAQIEAEIKALQRKIDVNNQQASSLKKEIDRFDLEIELKDKQISQSEYLIEQKGKELDLLKEDIRLLEIRLDRLDETISYHEELLADRIRERYIENQHSTLELLVRSGGVGDFVSQLEYLRRIQEEDKKLLDRMNLTKGNYEEQQKLLEEKKQEVETIKKEIEAQKALAEKYKADLEQQKLAKGQLLKVTKNNGQKYQELLADAQKELEQIQRAANVVIREGKGVDVKRGEVIGTMGNSGFSTGAHLHFGIYKYNVDDFQSHASWSWYYDNYLNPIDYLKSKTVNWGTGCSRDPSGNTKSGKGDWDWPMNNPRITQNFGSKTCYNWLYGNKPHPAMDMVGIGDVSVKSVDDGKAYFCRNCLNDGGNGVFVFHDNGKMSLYWHLK